jgi:serine phosphatase RsbU (regulator of sigma subunit)
MKHISTKILVLTLLLVSTLIIANGGLSLQVLSTESRAYTLQGQQSQTQAISKVFEAEFAKAREVAAKVFNLKIREEELKATLETILTEARDVNSSVQAIGIYLKEGTARWVETGENSISKDFKKDAKWIEAATGTYVLGDSSLGEDSLAVFPSKNVMVVVRIGFKRLKVECAGMNVGVFNKNGDPILFCSEVAEKKMKEAKDAVSEILASSFKSGTLEKHEGLWGYSDLLDIGKVMSVIDTQTAYRPAYVLGVKIVLLILMSVGIALVASIFVARKLSAPIIEVSGATAKIAQGEFDTVIHVDTQDETKTLADAVVSMAQKIKKLIESEIEKTKIEAQLEVAGAVQRIFIPETLVRFGRFKVSSFYKPADQCGGDWWGFIRGKDKVALLVGDVTGHGYASAMLVATTRGCVSMIQDQVDREGEINIGPREILRSFNRVVFEATRGEMNMTAFCLVLDVRRGTYHYSSAGHNPSFYLDSEGNKVKSMNASGSRLGDSLILAEEIEEITGEFRSARDKVVMFTDGIQDLGVQDQVLGRKGFKSFLAQHVGVSGEETVASVARDLIPLNQGAPLLDDITFLVIEQEADAAQTN